MGIIAWLVLGLIAGLLAELILGYGTGNLILTIGLGILGAFVGGIIGQALGLGSVTKLDLRSILIAIGGAVLVLFVYVRFF